ncbi:type B DNA-directed DNA polymerase [Natronomonas sp.]|uniref:type B DNA-directed DNA polymerase n=1 Tax=Natronomonas sp. TaxID=2184060 RepID=UPI002FC27F80
MVYCFDFIDGDVLAWSLSEDGPTVERVTGYTPSLYIGSRRADLAAIHDHVTELPAVRRTAIETWREGFRHEAGEVLRVDVESIEDVRATASTIGNWGEIGQFRLYNVDFTREFRYCLENDLTPTPQRSLRTLELSASPQALASDRLTTVTIDGTEVHGFETIQSVLRHRLNEIDPDVLVVSSSDLIPRLSELAGGIDLGRWPGCQKLAGESTYESYGQVGHSPARYNVPGRVIIDRSNTFMWDQTNLDGCLDLVERSGLPLQELAWASIGRILTAIQIREARERNVLVPWKAWRPEFFKSMRTLHDADRGGFTFAPDVGVHEDVHELDFSSLYPNIIVTRNISPETVRCECHEDRDDLPGLGYSICDEDGYLVDVLRPLIEDRDAIKAELRETDDPEHRGELEGRSNAIKWILVSCFGYQGFSNAKFGRIECHEAINAFAREILLDAKTVLEANGWQVIHGIVDSLWVTPRDYAEQTPLEAVCKTVTEQVDIRLEYESAYDWIAFVPRRDSEAGALTKYFGRQTDGDYKYRGIECRQRSTSPYVSGAQQELIEVFDTHREPERVCDVLADRITELRRGNVAASELETQVRVSKDLASYTRESRTTAALRRAKQQGVSYPPGESLSFVIADDDISGRDRVRLGFEDVDTYDAEAYIERLKRAAESILSPLGWRQRDIEQYLDDREDASLLQYAG